MVDSQRSELLEIYRLHAELADRVSQRREGANRLYVSLLMTLVLFLAALLRFTPGSVPGTAVVILACVTGAALSASWWLVIRSYCQLSTGKFKALHELEGHLAYAFYVREWELFGKGKDRARYWRLTKAETVLPWTFFLVFCGVMVAVLCLNEAG